jgi:hypothetical protein
VAFQPQLFVPFVEILFLRVLCVPKKMAGSRQSRTPYELLSQKQTFNGLGKFGKSAVTDK